MEGKKNKTKGLKIVYFPTSIRRNSQMNALGDTLDWLSARVMLAYF